MPRLLRLVLAPVRPRPARRGLLAATATSAGAHEERRRSSPTAPARCRSSSATTTRATGWSAGRSRAPRIAKMPDGQAASGATSACCSECRFGSIQDADQHASGSGRRRSTCCPASTRSASRPATKRSYYCSHLGTASTHAAAELGVHRQHLLPRGAARRRRRGAAEADGTTNPIGAVVRRPAQVPAQPQPDRALRRPTPGNKSIRCDSRFCGTQIVGTGRRMTDVLVDNRFQKLNAIRADRVGGVVPPQHDLPAGRVQRGLRAGDRRVRARPADRPRQRRVRHPRVRQRPRPDPAHQQLLQRRLGHLPRLGLGPQRQQHEARRSRATPSRSATTAATTTRSATPARPATRSGRTTTSSTTTPPASRPTRSSPATRACPRTTPGGATTRSTATTRTTTRAYVDKGVCDKPMAERGYIHGTVCPVIPTPGRHRRPDRRRQLQPHRPQLDLRQLALRHHAVLGAGAAARRVRPGQALRHLAPQPHDRQPHGLRPRTARSCTTAWTTGGTTQGIGNCWERQQLVARQADRQLRAAAALLRGGRLDRSCPGWS